jgi:hypothetical protein
MMMAAAAVDKIQLQNRDQWSRLYILQITQTVTAENE